MSASAALEEAESIDGYRAACNASVLNAAAREKQAYAPHFLKRAELVKLNDAMRKIPILSTMDVIILHASADNGFPHTRPNSLICMPSSSIGDETALINTLTHEAVHIHQRRNAELWSSACKKEGWMPVPKARIPTEFADRCRLNPDTMATPFWAWETYNVPLPLFVREDYPTLEGVSIKWLDLRNGALFGEPPSSFGARYGNPPQPEHPYELLAVEYAAAELQTEDAIIRKLQSI